MGEFICGLFFYVIGIALLIYNKTLVERSVEFYPQNLSTNKIEWINIFNRFLCVFAGLLTSGTGLLIMLGGR
ncbi:MAG: hypothetical protein M3405_17695 [Acidobacteriota bacterium]|nr:hypothetical protein [Acidobacteriota bacterium]